MKNLEQIVLGKRKGQFSKVTWGKELKVPKELAKLNVKVTKISECVARFGVEYDNIKDVKLGRENGILPQTNQGLTWGTWKKYPYFIEHKGKDYLRISLVNNNKIKSRYFLNGNEINYDTAKDICLKSEFKSSSQNVEILTISTDNIINIE